MAMTDTFFKRTKHTGKISGDKHHDAGGLYLLVKKGGKYWRMDYTRPTGGRNTLALGVYPTVSLAVARRKRDAAHEQLAEGLDPGKVKHASRILAQAEAAQTFEAVAREFHATQSQSWSSGHSNRWLRRLEKDLFPYLGHLTLPEISAPILLQALKRVERRGVGETVHSLRQSAGQLFRYGIQTGRCERNPVPDLQGALRSLVFRSGKSFT